MSSSPEPQPGKPGVSVRIIKHDDTNFGTSPLSGGGAALAPDARQGYVIGAEFKPTYAMPTGPGFEPNDPAIALAGGRRRRTGKTRSWPRGILRKTIKPSHNPTKAPATRKRSVVIVSEHKVKKARETLKRSVTKTPIGTIRKKLVEKKIISDEKKTIPPTVLRKLYVDAVGAGLLS